MTYVHANEGIDRLLAGGYTTSLTLSGSANQRAVVLKANAETTDLENLRVFEETSFSSFKNGGTDYGNTVVFTTE